MQWLLSLASKLEIKENECEQLADRAGWRKCSAVHIVDRSWACGKREKAHILSSYTIPMCLRFSSLCVCVCVST